MYIFEDYLSLSIPGFNVYFGLVFSCTKHVPPPPLVRRIAPLLVPEDTWLYRRTVLRGWRFSGSVWRCLRSSQVEKVLDLGNSPARISGLGFVVRVRLQGGFG